MNGATLRRQSHTEPPEAAIDPNPGPVRRSARLGSDDKGKGEGDAVKTTFFAVVPASDRVRVRRLVGIAIAGSLALLALQAVAAARLELTFDEAYYALWSRSLSFGYLDHPPMVALWIRASTAIFGDSSLGVRALSLIAVGSLPALVAWIAWRLFRSTEIAALAAILWIAMPLVMAGAIFVTPDGPLTVFWTLGLAALVELWRRERPVWLLALGIAFGLGLQSKFTIFFFAAGVGLAFLAAPSLRRWLLSLWTFAALALAAAIFAPFVAWNAAHGWATFRKQFGRAPPHGFEPYFLAEFIVAQIGLMNPFVFAPFVGALLRVRWRGRVEPKSAEEARRILVCTIAPAVLYFFAHALHDRVEGNWLAPLFPAAAILAADWIARVSREHATGWKARIANAAPWGALPAFVMMAFAYFQATTGVLPLGDGDPTARLEGYRQLADDLTADARAIHAPYVLTQGYALTSLMRAYAGDDVAIVQPEERIRWIFEPPPPANLFEQPGLALGEAGRHFDLYLQVRYRSVEPVGALTRRRDGRPVEKYELFRVADPYAPVLDEECVSGNVTYRRTADGFARQCAE